MPAVATATAALASNAALAASCAAGRAKSRCMSCSARSKGLCSALKDEELPRLSAISHHKDYAPEEPVIREADEAEALFTITSGMAKVYKTLPDGRRVITGFATAGDALGLAAGGRYAYSVDAVTPLSVCRAFRPQMETLVRENPQVQGRLLSMASLELTAAQDQILLLGCKNATERLCSFLLSMARRQGKDGDASPTLYLPISKQDISAYLGLRPETLSRVLRKLQDNGVIAWKPGSRVHLKVSSIERLEELANAAE